MSDRPTLKTDCAACGSVDVCYFSRIEPMGYFCPECGQKDGEPVERQCSNQGKSMAQLIRELDETRKKAERYRFEANAKMMQRDEARWQRDEAREDATHWKAQCQNGFNIAEIIRERDEAREQIERLSVILVDILAYNKGEKPHDYWALPNHAQANTMAFDAWQEILNKIEQALNDDLKKCIEILGEASNEYPFLTDAEKMERKTP